MVQARICVLGGGIVGVSSAVRILEMLPEAEVTIMSDRFSPNTTSDVSGGFWEPHLLGDTPTDKIRAWGQETLDYMTDLVFSVDAKDVGAQLVSGYAVSDVPPSEFEDPFWRDLAYGYRPLEAREIKRFPGKRFRMKGGKLVQRRVNRLQDLIPENYDVILNCTGVMASKLLNDKAVKPVRGQVIRVQAPWVKHFCIAVSKGDDEFGYVLPGARCVVMGGTEQVGDWNTDVSLSDKTTIFDTCCKYVPSLKNAVVDMDCVGLRPARTAVRLERETIAAGSHQQHVVHNYGHGGAGVTLHWGCAAEAARLVAETLGEEAPRAKL